MTTTTNKTVQLVHLDMSGHASSWVEMPAKYDPAKITEADLQNDASLRVLSAVEAAAKEGV